MQSVGTRLRDARVKKNLTQEDVNARTRISLKNIQAIEADDLSKISSPFTYRSFVKQIAEVLGIDYETIAPDVQTASNLMPEPLVPGQGDEQIVRPNQLRVKVRRDLTWLYRGVSVLAIAGLASGYLLWRSGGVDLPKLPENVVSASGTPKSSSPAPTVQLPDSKPAEKPRQQSAALPVATPTRQPAVQSVAPGTEQLLSPASSQRRSNTAPAAKPAAAIAKPPAANRPTTIQPISRAAVAPTNDFDSAIHIELSAVERTWLSIVADGKPTYAGYLEAAETKVLDGRETARIRTANAGGVNIIFNGRALGTMGRHGQSRTFVFTKTGYEVVQGIGNVELTRVSPSGE